MLQHLLTILFITNGFIIFSQKEINSTNKHFVIDDEIMPVAHCEILPKYIGGHLKMINDIKNNLQYPNSQVCISGRVYVSYIIDTLGQVTNVETIRGINDEFDKEAVRVVKLLNNWFPGIQNGKKVKVKYIIPINFRLE